MTSQAMQKNRWAEVNARAQGSQPMFFYDGDFRTWDQVQQRAQLNAAINQIVNR